MSRLSKLCMDAATKRSKSIAIESFGNLVKRRKEVPNIDALIQQKIKILNSDKATISNSEIMSHKKQCKINLLDYNREKQLMITKETFVDILAMYKQGKSLR